MKNIQIKLLDTETSIIPYNLLYLADPSVEAVKDYLERGYCYIAMLEEKIIGECVLLPTRNFNIELVNLDVDEPYQNKGYGKQLINHAISIDKN